MTNPEKQKNPANRRLLYNDQTLNKIEKMNSKNQNAQTSSENATLEANFDSEKTSKGKKQLKPRKTSFWDAYGTLRAKVKDAYKNEE